MSKYKYSDFLDKIIVDYNKKHKIDNEYYYNIENTLYYFDKKYNKTENIIDLYIRLFHAYEPYLDMMALQYRNDYVRRR